MSCLAPSAQATAGLEPGVHADPGSPAAKQYALPLNQARQTGANPAGHEGPSASHEESSTGHEGPSAAREGSSTGAPFGAGIHPPRTRGYSRSHSHSHSTTSGARRRHTIHRASPAGVPGTNAAIRPVALRAATTHTEGGGSLLTLLGGTIAILILVGLGGTLMHRSRRSVSSA
jgi:hypothetical protein